MLEDVNSFVKKTRSETLQATDGRSSKISKEIPKLKKLISTLEMGTKGPTMSDAVALAWAAFHELFRDILLDLTEQFPDGSKDKKGEPFWSGHKRFPKAAHYDASNPEHVAFMLATSNLFAAMLGIPGKKPPSSPASKLRLRIACVCSPRRPSPSPQVRSPRRSSTSPARCAGRRRTGPRSGSRGCSPK